MPQPPYTEVAYVETEPKTGAVRVLGTEPAPGDVPEKRIWRDGLWTAFGSIGNGVFAYVFEKRFPRVVEDSDGTAADPAEA